MCEEAEAIALSIREARERSVAIRKIGSAASRSSHYTIEVDIALRYLIAMLKVNFRPLWTESADAIASLSKNRNSADLLAIWSILFTELQIATTMLSQVAIEVEQPTSTTTVYTERNLKVPFSGHTEFICSSNDKIDKVFLAWLNGLSEASGSSSVDRHYKEEQTSSDTLHVTSYEEQLLATCKATASLTEKHSRDFVTLFLDHFAKQSVVDSTSAGGKAGRARLAAWLAVFASFKNPKALYQSSVLYDQHLRNLSHGDSSIQTLALDCILTWKSPNLVAHAEHLHNLLDSDKFRDQLLEFSLAEESDFLLPQRRPEVVPVLIRILYGLMSSRQGRAAAVHVQKGRKAAIMATLRSCTPAELDTLVDLMLGPFSDQLSNAQPVFHFSHRSPVAQTSVQLGYLSLCADVLKYLGEKVKKRWYDLLAVVLNLAFHAQRSDLESAEGAPKKRVRQLALRRLADFFSADPGFDFSGYMTAIFQGLISPRLAKFSDENLQAPSALLELVVTWSAEDTLVGNLASHDSRLLPALFGCLGAPSVKDSVISRVLLVVQNLLRHAEEEGDGGKTREDILMPCLDDLLANMALLLARKAGTITVREELGMRQIRVLASLSSSVQSTETAKVFVPILLPLLRKSNALLPEHIKMELLQVLQALLPLAFSGHVLAIDSADTAYKEAYDTVSSLFGILKTRNSRVKLMNTFEQFGTVDATRARVISLLQELNAFSTRRVEEPDFDRRLPAFTLLNDEVYQDLTGWDWTPIVHNMFLFMQDPEELSIRSNANLSLRRFVEVAGPSLDAELRLVFTKVFLPDLKSGLRSKVEMVRVEVLSVLAAAVQASTGVAELDEMKGLLADGDPEANFFNNIYHVQVHRRGRALRRLAEEVEAGRISASTAADIFIPLLAFNLTSISEQKQAELVNETVQSISRMVRVIPWSQYNRLLQQYLKLASEKREGQKVFLRTTVAILRSFHFDLHADASGSPSKLLPTVTQRLLPRLMQYLETRDTAEETLRIPMAEGIASVLQSLPEDIKAGDVTSLITALAQILKSKAQDVRDMARATLVNIAASLGHVYLDIVLKELRAALTRGPQLHVLAFTAHALLARLATTAEAAVFDAAVDNVAAIVYDDVVRCDLLASVTNKLSLSCSSDSRAKIVNLQSSAQKRKSERSDLSNRSTLSRSWPSMYRRHRSPD